MGKAGAVSTPTSTDSTSDTDAGIPRPEYPRPSLVRPDWLNLIDNPISEEILASLEASLGFKARSGN